MISRNVCFGLFILPVIFGVDMDYLAPALRSRSLNCQSMLHQEYCRLKCLKTDALCVHDSCFCLSSADANEFIRNNDKKSWTHDDVIEDVNSGEAEVPDQTRIDNVALYALRPTVRHHIAHFCPNLDVARECIRTCMAQGKPAFCGKDHVCYCGHKYSNTDNNAQVDIKEMYAQFHDLYTKYFGVDHSIEH